MTGEVYLVDCEECKGTGYIDCEECEGTGMTGVLRNAIAHGHEYVEEWTDACPECDGACLKRCEECDGSGKVEF